ncbi:hypothetical protein P4O66_019288, partial [Electrophorus voltai]
GVFSLFTVEQILLLNTISMMLLVCLCASVAIQGRSEHMVELLSWWRWTRRKTVEEIKCRACSAGEWPQCLLACTPSEEEKRDPALYASDVSGDPAWGWGTLRHAVNLKAAVTDQLCGEEVSKARKLCGCRMCLEDLAEYLHLPVTDTLQDVFALFEEHPSPGPVCSAESAPVCMPPEQGFTRSVSPTMLLMGLGSTRELHFPAMKMSITYMRASREGSAKMKKQWAHRHLPSLDWH